MEKSLLERIMIDHVLWLKTNGVDGARARLDDANLNDADLTGANLSYADLTGADLSYADLSYANLTGAKLNDADLNDADLRRADLSYADLTGAKLNDANLRRADLSYADLNDADLSYAKLNGANLSGAKNLLSAIDFLKENFENTVDGYIVYKTFNSQHKASDGWKVEPGAVIEETPNPDRGTDCGSGINVAPLDWVRSRYKSRPIWKLLIRWEWLPGVVVPFGTDGKIRCERAELIGIEEN